jgi:amino acid adenylation domain-containing protein
MTTAKSPQDALRSMGPGTLAGDPPAGPARGEIVFLFPGQGSQYLGMGRGLFETQPAFRRALEQCAAVIDPMLGRPLLEVIYPALGPAPEPALAHAHAHGAEQDSPLDETDFVQPALFAIAVSLAAQWRAWGVTPDVVIGQSQGEIAAACVSGALRLEDAAKVVCRRSRLMKQHVAGRGAMAVVGLSEAQARARLAAHGERLSVAIVNGPNRTVVSGDPEAMTALLAELDAARVFARLVNTDCAGHSAQMDVLRDELVAALADISPRVGSVPFFSTVTCEALRGDELAAAYWFRNLREPVRFADAVPRLLAGGARHFLEISPHPLLPSALAHFLEAAPHAAWLPSLQRGEDDGASIAQSLAALAARGVRLDPSAPALPSGPAEPAPRARVRAAPRTPIEEIIAGICAELLKVEQVGIDDNFFAIGGHSLRATQLVSRIARSFGVDLPLRRVFEQPTLAGLARVVEQLLGAPPAKIASLVPVAGDEAGRTVPRAGAPPLEAGARERELALSFAQERLWFLDQLEEPSATYHTPLVFRLGGVLDPVALATSLEAVVQRHESLRTIFVTRDGRPVQVIKPARALPLPVEDLEALPEREREAAVQARVTREARRTFDLAHGPLVRARLFRLAGDHHVLVVATHHIVWDGWSTGVFGRELGELYRAAVEHRAPTLAPLALQYPDFAAWQRRWLSGAVLASELAYWKHQLLGAPALLDLPTDRPRPPVQSFRGAFLRFRISRKLATAVTAVSRREHVTPFMTLLAAFQALLFRYTGQPKIVVGSPIANRTRLETEGLIGLFVNTLALATEVSGALRFRALLARVRDVTLGAYAHQDLPFEKVVAELAPERSLNHSPIFQTLFTLQNVPAQALDLPGLTVARVGAEQATARVDLSLALREDEGGLAATIEYSTDLFDEATIERLAGHYRRLLEAAVANLEQTIGGLPLLSDAERRQLLVAWNDTGQGAPRDRGVHGLFEAQVERSPDAVAVVFEATEVTYRELDVRANRVARWLAARGAGRGSRVAVTVERGAHMVAAVLGVMKAGAAYVPIDPSYSAERRAFIRSDAGVIAELDDATLREAVASASKDDERHASQAVQITGDDVAYVLYTSSSTGRPKGIMIPHRAVVSFLGSMAREPGLQPTDTLLAVTTLSSGIAGLELYLPLSVGAKLVVASRDTATDPARLANLLAISGATVMQATPATWKMLVTWGFRPPSHLRILCGGEALPPDLAELLAAGSGGLWNMYGPTEATIWSTCTQFTPGQRVTIGRPIGNTRVYVVDAHLRPTPIGVPGELCIGGEGVAHGYLHRPALTAASFVGDPFATRPGARMYRTGDLARWLADGTLEYLGRLDLGVELPVRRIFEDKTVAGLATSVEVTMDTSALLGNVDQLSEHELDALLQKLARDGATTP